MVQLAKYEDCTGCGACSYICSRNCIDMQENNIGIVRPVVDTNTCIDCHRCEKACPVLNIPERNTPFKVYAAWSLDEEQRKTSASGGVAYELYKYAIQNDYLVVGASQNSDFSVSLKAVSKLDDIVGFKNSKYVFSEAWHVFPDVQNAIKQDKKILFVGLPCQVAAAKSLFHDKGNILYIEILCHGTTPLSYLKQHIKMLENASGRKAASMSFRAPEAYTYTYTFTLYDEQGECFYAKCTNDGDAYQYGYHRGVAYRENCYHCAFATPERVGDLILCDFYGLGNKFPCSYDVKNVSCIILNTEKGDTFIKELISSNVIFTEGRPVEEAVEGNPRLRIPNPKTKERLVFEKNINKYNGDYEESIEKLNRAYQRYSHYPRIVKSLIYRTKLVLGLK